jgi:hypothetical protein
MCIRWNLVITDRSYRWRAAQCHDDRAGRSFDLGARAGRILLATKAQFRLN